MRNRYRQVLTHSQDVQMQDFTPLLLNPGALNWEKTTPALAERSPEYAILHGDPKTRLTMIMFRTPVAARYTHYLSRISTIEEDVHVLSARESRSEIASSWPP